MSQTNTTNYHKTFNGLATGTIVLSSIVLGLVLISVIIVLALAVSTRQQTPDVVAATVLALTIIECVCDVGLIVLMSVSIALVGKLSGKLTSKGVTNYRITFGILLGLFSLFWILALALNGSGAVSSVFAFFELAAVILILIFTCIYRNKVNK